MIRALLSYIRAGCDDHPIIYQNNKDSWWLRENYESVEKRRSNGSYCHLFHLYCEEHHKQR